MMKKNKQSNIDIKYKNLKSKIDLTPIEELYILDYEDKIDSIINEENIPGLEYYDIHLSDDSNELSIGWIYKGYYIELILSDTSYFSIDYPQVLDIKQLYDMHEIDDKLADYSSIDEVIKVVIKYQNLANQKVDELYQAHYIDNAPYTVYHLARINKLYKRIRYIPVLIIIPGIIVPLSFLLTLNQIYLSIFIVLVGIIGSFYTYMNKVRKIKLDLQNKEFITINDKVTHAKFIQTPDEDSIKEMFLKLELENNNPILLDLKEETYKHKRECKDQLIGRSIQVVCAKNSRIILTGHEELTMLIDKYKKEKNAYFK